jgi:bifunctional DNA-binding transcriptional regulator/antitoxin component of YhaV-PrlF toxin-antitoxin module
MSSAIVSDDYSVTLPKWVLEGLELTVGDDVEFVRIAGEPGFLIKKVEAPSDSWGHTVNDKPSKLDRE